MTWFMRQTPGSRQPSAEMKTIAGGGLGSARQASEL